MWNISLDTQPCPSFETECVVQPVAYKIRITSRPVANKTIITSWDTHIQIQKKNSSQLSIAGEREMCSQPFLTSICIIADGITTIESSTKSPYPKSGALQEASWRQDRQTYRHGESVRWNGTGDVLTSRSCCMQSSHFHRSAKWHEEDSVCLQRLFINISIHGLYFLQ